MRYFLDIEVVQCDKCIFICQSKYIKDVLKKFKMMNCVDVSFVPLCNISQLNIWYGISNTWFLSWKFNKHKNMRKTPMFHTLVDTNLVILMWFDNNQVGRPTLFIKGLLGFWDDGDDVKYMIAK